MNNEPEYRLILDKDLYKGMEIPNIHKEILNQSISLEMTLNLSDKKNRDNIEKLLYSFYKLKLLYNNLIKKINTKLSDADFPPVEFGYFRNNQFVKMFPIELISPTDEVKCYPSYKLDILLIDYEKLKRGIKILRDENERKLQALLKR